MNGYVNRLTLFATMIEKFPFIWWFDRINNSTYLQKQVIGDIVLAITKYNALQKELVENRFVIDMYSKTLDELQDLTVGIIEMLVKIQIVIIMSKHKISPLMNRVNEIIRGPIKLYITLHKSTRVITDLTNYINLDINAVFIKSLLEYGYSMFTVEKLQEFSFRYFNILNYEITIGDIPWALKYDYLTTLPKLTLSPTIQNARILKDLKRTDNVKNLKISEPGVNVDYNNARDIINAMKSWKFKNLKTLHLDSAIAGYYNFAPSLKELTLSHNKGPVINLPNLDRLNIFMMNISQVDDSFYTCKSLSLEHCTIKGIFKKKNPYLKEFSDSASRVGLYNMNNTPNVEIINIYGVHVQPTPRVNISENTKIRNLSLEKLSIELSQKKPISIEEVKLINCSFLKKNIEFIGLIDLYITDTVYATTKPNLKIGALSDSNLTIYGCDIVNVQCYNGNAHELSCNTLIFADNYSTASLSLVEVGNLIGVFETEYLNLDAYTFERNENLLKYMSEIDIMITGDQDDALIFRNINFKNLTISGSLDFIYFKDCSGLVTCDAFVNMIYNNSNKLSIESDDKTPDYIKEGGVLKRTNGDIVIKPALGIFNIRDDGVIEDIHMKKIMPLVNGINYV